jgi:hypothetical protein
VESIIINLITMLMQPTPKAARLIIGVSAPSEAWCILQGESPCRVRVSHPPVSSVASVAEQKIVSVNKTGEAYTENHAGRRGDRAP